MASSSAAQDLIQKMRTTKAANDRTYPNYGRYRLRILNIGAKRGFKGLSGFIQMKVISAEPLSSFPENLPAEEPRTPNRVGETVNYTESDMENGKKGEGASARFKSALMKVFGETDESKADATLVAAVDEVQPGAFIDVDCEVFPKFLPANPPKYPTGKYLTGYRWTHVDPVADMARIDADRAAAKLTGTFVQALGG